MSQKSPEEQLARLESLREMLADDPESEFLRYGVAMQLKGLGRAAEALEEFAHLVRESPDYVPTYYHYAALLAEEGRPEEALSLATEGVARAEAAGNAHAAAELRDLLDEWEG